MLNVHIKKIKQPKPTNLTQKISIALKTPNRFRVKDNNNAVYFELKMRNKIIKYLSDTSALGYKQGG